MPSETIYWTWEEAFDKFGFDDGDGLVFTNLVIETLQTMPDRTLSIQDTVWGAHNQVITEIKDGDTILWGDSVCDVGYSDPRDVLPPDIIAYLDTVFPA